MVSRLTEIEVDGVDVAGLVRFWCSALGYVVQVEEDGVVTIGPPGTAGAQDPSAGPGAPVLTFAPVPEAKAGKNRVHLDLTPHDRPQQAEVERLLALGARRAEVGQTGAEGWVVLADPEGNEFCVLAGDRT